MKIHCKLPTVCVLLLLWSACDTQQRPQTLTKSGGELNASVTWTGTSFIVTNEGPSDWPSVIVAACPVGMYTFLGGGYTTILDPLKEGETIEVKVWEFRRAFDQKRLNMHKTKLSMFAICEGGTFRYVQGKDAKRWYGQIY